MQRLRLVAVVIAVAVSWTVASSAFADVVDDNPAVASHETGRVVLAARGADGNVFVKGFWNSYQTTWSPWFPIGAPSVGATSGPAIADHGSSGTGAVDVFVRGGDGAIWAKQIVSGDNLKPWVSLGGSFLSAPAATVSASGNEVYVVGVAADHAVWINIWSQSSLTWSGWLSLGGGFYGTPSIYSQPTGVAGKYYVAVWGRGSDNAVYERVWSDLSASWSAWADIYGDLSGAPSAEFDGPAVQVFGRGNSGLLVGRAWTGSAWQAWYNVDGYQPIDSAPAAVSDAPGRIQVFARRSGTIQQKQYNGGWGTWYDQGAPHDEYPTSTRYGGADYIVSTPSEIDDVISAAAGAASDAEAVALRDGLAPADLARVRSVPLTFEAGSEDPATGPITEPNAAERAELGSDPADDADATASAAAGRPKRGCRDTHDPHDFKSGVANKSTVGTIIMDGRYCWDAYKKTAIQSHPPHIELPVTLNRASVIGNYRVDVGDAVAPRNFTCPPWPQSCANPIGGWSDFPSDYEHAVGMGVAFDVTGACVAGYCVNYHPEVDVTIARENDYAKGYFFDRHTDGTYG
jgi:hypothetical protein